MSFDTDRLYNLLPAIYRIRDLEEGQPLKIFLSVIAEQIQILEENLEQLYDDQFIETCAEWVVPYIGDLIGYRGLHGVAPKISSPRAEVAHTITYRRRKGTATMLEQLARDVTGWNARVVEFFELLATTQYMNHVRPQNVYAPDLRKWERLERLHTPFDQVAHTAEVRRMTVDGRYNIPNMGIFLWRLNACPLTNTPAFKIDDRRYLFNPLGINTPLFSKPETEDEISHLAEPVNVPQPISRRVLAEYLELFYGSGKSLQLQVGGVAIDPTQIIVCNLSDSGSDSWAHLPPDGFFAIDPVLGRIALPGNLTFTEEVQVSFHYGFSANMGGGEYERGNSFDKFEPKLTVSSAESTIQSAIDTLLTPPNQGGVVEISDNGRYSENLVIDVKSGSYFELRAANEHRPMIVLNEPLQITGEDAEVTLNGLLITGGSIRIPETATLRRLRLRHCTLVPGLSLNINGEPVCPEQPSLIVEQPNIVVEIESCITGGLRITADASIKISDSIIDATGETGVAFANIDHVSAGGQLHLVDATVIGKVHTRVLKLASNCIFVARLAADDTWTAPVRVERKQTGCVRFSYLPLNAVVPRWFHCHPANAREDGRVRPQFTSLHYGEPGYGQLRTGTVTEIRTGAEDEGEMGALHKLYQPQREINLRVRLDEYLRFGLQAGIFYVS